MSGVACRGADIWSVCEQLGGVSLGGAAFIKLIAVISLAKTQPSGRAVIGGEKASITSFREQIASYANLRGSECLPDILFALRLFLLKKSGVAVQLAG